MAPIGKSRSWNYVSLAVKVLLSALLVAWVLRETDIRSVFFYIRNLTWLPFLASIFICLCVKPLILAARWQVLAPALLTYGQALRYTWVGFLYGLLLPGGLTADVAKGASLAFSDRSARKADLPVSIFLERLVAAVSVLLTFAATCVYLLAFFPEGDFRRRIATFATTGLLLTSLMLLPVALFALESPRAVLGAILGRLCHAIGWKPKFDLLWTSLSDCLKQPTTIWRSFLLSAAAQVFLFLQSWFLLRAIGSDLGIAGTLVVNACVSAATMLPVSVAGIGIREWVNVILFPAFGQDSSKAIAFSWLWLGLSLLLAVGGALFQLAALVNVQGREGVQQGRISP